MFALKTHQAHSRCLAASFLLCIDAHSFSRMFASPKEKKKRKDFLCSGFNTLGWQTYHYSQIGISSLISTELKVNEDPNYIFSNVVKFCSFMLCDYFSGCLFMEEWFAFYFFFASFLVFVKVSWTERHYVISFCSRVEIRKCHPCIGWLDNYLN